MTKFAAVGIAALSAALLSLGSAPAQAAAAGEPAPAPAVAAGADAETRQWVGDNATMLRAAANPCGGPYQTIAYVDGRLPGDGGNDDGSMVAYAGGTGYLCVVFYNETPGGANEMYLNVCPGKTSGPGCGTDNGNYASHAGPITISDTGCFTAAYKMRNQADTTWLINGKRSYGPRC
jgi:hypothetical protein